MVPTGLGLLPTVLTTSALTPSDRQTGVRMLAALISLGRLVVGIAFIAEPTLMERGWIGKQARLPGAQVLARAVGARDLVLGLGGLQAARRDDGSARPWLAGAAVCDGVDFGATWAAGRGIPSQPRNAVLAIAARVRAALGARSGRDRSLPGRSDRPRRLAMHRRSEPVDEAFVVNLADAPAATHSRRATLIDLEPDGVDWPDMGVNVQVMQPGQPNCRYHSEPVQEDFLVLHGECLAIVDGKERPLRQWDFLHCPAGTEHVFVGAGDGPCAVLMLGSRREDAAHYPRRSAPNPWPID